MYVVDPATFLASNSVLGTLFCSEKQKTKNKKQKTKNVFISYGKDDYISVCIITSLILLLWKFWVCISSLKPHSAPLNYVAQFDTSGSNQLKSQIYLSKQPCNIDMLLQGLRIKCIIHEVNPNPPHRNRNLFITIWNPQV